MSVEKIRVSLKAAGGLAWSEFQKLNRGGFSVAGQFALPSHRIEDRNKIIYNDLRHLSNFAEQHVDFSKRPGSEMFLSPCVSVNRCFIARAWMCSSEVGFPAESHPFRGAVLPVFNKTAEVR